MRVLTVLKIKAATTAVGVSWSPAPLPPRHQRHQSVTGVSPECHQSGHQDSRKRRAKCKQEKQAREGRLMAIGLALAVGVFLVGSPLHLDLGIASLSRAPMLMNLGKGIMVGEAAIGAIVPSEPRDAIEQGHPSRYASIKPY